MEWNFRTITGLPFSNRKRKSFNYGPIQANLSIAQTKIVFTRIGVYTKFYLSYYDYKFFNLYGLSQFQVPFLIFRFSSSATVSLLTLNIQNPTLDSKFLKNLKFFYFQNSMIRTLMPKVKSKEIKSKIRDPPTIYSHRSKAYSGERSSALIPGKSL